MSNEQRTVIHLLRHGEVHNPEGVLYGRLPDYHLSDLGRQMAERVAAHLMDHDIVRVIASPLERAQETAAPIAARHRLKIVADDRVIEAANEFEGRRFDVMAAARRLPLLRNPFRPSWGEPYADIADRMLASITDARAAAAGHECVIVSHQLPVWTARQQLEGKRLWHDPRSRECALASLTTLTYREDQLESITYSEPAAELLADASKVPGA